jgi:nucleotide-binding universal stress UspA family protein
MYQHIMVPVDLGHVDRLDKALTTGADLASHYQAAVTYVGVTTSAPGSVAHTPKEFESKLDTFARNEAAKRGLGTAHAHVVVSHDPARDLHKALLTAARDIGADLIVMASHVPGLADHIFESNAGAVALHADVPVFIVR